ncbi:hypothetical protein [Deinococcus ficus]|uniref:hypothetical protein n=1 Tax=Deinococcus ficus TaxID=317577 RepID=UPI00131B6148|nr:hypothetical protein [Deinococcus ficus]
MIKDTYANFTKLLKEGEDGEDTVINFLQSRGNTIVDKARDKGYFPDWDIKFKNTLGTELTAEVKTDKSVSNNLVVEYKSRGKPSGIYSTKADYYFIYFVNDGTIYVCNSAELRLWISENSPKKVMNKNNDSDTYLYLIPKDTGLFTPYEL